MPILGITASSILKVTISYESIATVTVGSGGSSTVTFSSIPQTYKHLQIRSLEQQSAGGYASITLDNATFVRRHYLLGNGTAASSGSDTTNAPGIFGTNATNGINIFGASIIDILDYTNTNKNKTLRAFGGQDSNGGTGGGTVGIISSLFTSSSTVTSITLTAVTSDFAQYSQFALYGIRG
jgi:hypothetical protein